MAGYLVSILGLGLLCAAWVGLDLWLRHLNPRGRAQAGRCGRCGHCAGTEEAPPDH